MLQLVRRIDGDVVEAVVVLKVVVDVLANGGERRSVALRRHGSAIAKTGRQ